MAILEEEISVCFEGMLKAHDLNPVRHKEWVSVDDGFPVFRAIYTPPTKERASGSLLAQIMLDKDTLIEELFAAYGDSDAEAVQGAMMSFNICMFHPILSAFGIDVPDDQITRETWKSKNSRKVVVWSGNIGPRMSEGVQASPPVGWFAALEQAVSETSLTKGWSWATAYYGRLKSDAPSASATLNNELWERGLQATLDLDWPVSEGFYGCRLFFLMHNKGGWF